jgi:hypothetical protein
MLQLSFAVHGSALVSGTCLETFKCRFCPKVMLAIIHEI